MAMNQKTQEISHATPLYIPSRLRLWAASLAIEAGILHIIACSDHFREWWGYGVFFLIVSLCQIGGGIALTMRTGRTLLWVGIVGTVVVLNVWLVSRTIGIHIGPDGAAPEAIGLLDALAVGCELGLIYCLIRLLMQPMDNPSAL